jgi:cyclopropane-fatty-acyl-phospholipid synthase
VVGRVIIYAAQHYGVEAHGITLSKLQAELVNKRIQEVGLAKRCSVDVSDYREMDKQGYYEKIASVEMIEHVCRVILPVYFQYIWHLLRPGGIFLSHGIAGDVSVPTIKGLAFIKRYVFPNGELAPINVTLKAAEECGFEVRGIESLREHYVLT